MKKSALAGNPRKFHLSGHFIQSKIRESVERNPPKTYHIISVDLKRKHKEVHGKKINYARWRYQFDPIYFFNTK